MTDYETILVTREAIQGPIGLVDEHIPGSYAEDYDWILRAALAGPIAVVEEPLVRVRWGQSLFSSRWQTIIEALATIGIKVQVSCEQGICGTCLCNVLDGTPDHRDVFLTDEEKADNDQILLCCSRALSDTLVLDL